MNSEDTTLKKAVIFFCPLLMTLALFLVTLPALTVLNVANFQYQYKLSHQITYV